MERFDALLVTLAAMVAATLLGLNGVLPGEAVAAILGGALPNPIMRGAATKRPVDA